MCSEKYRFLLFNTWLFTLKIAVETIVGTCRDIIADSLVLFLYARKLTLNYKNHFLLLC